MVLNILSPGKNRQQEPGAISPDQEGEGYQTGIRGCRKSLLGDLATHQLE